MTFRLMACCIIRIMVLLLTLYKGVRLKMLKRWDASCAGFLSAPLNVFAARIGIMVVLILSVASFGASPPKVSARAYMDASAIRRGGRVNIMVLVSLPKSLHVNSHKPKDEWLIPTMLSFKLPKWLKVERIHYPPGKMLRTSFGELSVYKDEFTLIATLLASPDAPIGEHRITAHLNYQACDERRCYPPSSLQLPITITVVGEGGRVFPTNVKLFRQHASWLKSPYRKEQAQVEKAIGVGASERISSLIARFGWGVTLLIIFAFGVALNLTPCVFPLVPITVGYFVSRSHANMRKLLVEALLYVFGIAITYSLIGIAAGLTGGLFGSVLQHPIALIAVAGIIAILAFGMFGVYEIELPSRLLGVLHSFAQAVGPIGLGMVAGLIAAPCIGPFTVALIAFVAASGSALIGFLCFFALSLGLGLPYMFLAVFSGSLHRLPKSGVWMEWVRKALGFALLALAVYLVMPLMPHIVAPFALPALLLVAGVHLGWLTPSQGERLRFSIFARLIGSLMVVSSIGLLMRASYIVGYERGYDAGRAASSEAIGNSLWKDYSPELLEKALKMGKPIAIKFTAKWCSECRKLEQQTLSSKSVLNELKGLICFRVDLTFKNSAAEELRRRYKVVGLPTIIFVSSDGKELRHLRVEGFVDEAELLARLRQLR